MSLLDLLADDGESLLTPDDLVIEKAAEGPQPAPAFRSFIDPAATREAIYGKSLEAMRGLKPLANQKYTLSLHDVDYADPPAFPRKVQKQAILEGRTLARRLRGTWRVTDNATGDVVSEKNTTLAHVPYYNDGGTFIVNGNELSLGNQLRLRPGVFTRRKENGELESHINVLSHEGLSHRVHLDPETGVFKMQVGQSELPLLPILRALGVKDSQVREHWGDLFPANAAKADAQAATKFAARLLREQVPGEDEASRGERMLAALAKMPLDPEVTKSTLGHPHDRITPDVYLAATRKLIQLNRGEVEPDDRDHLAYMTVHGPEDLLSERILKDQGALRKAFWRATMKKGDISGMPAGVFTKAMQAAIQSSGLGQPLECYSEDTLVLTARGFVPWPAVRDDDLFACRIDGKVEYHRASKITRAAYAGPMFGCRSKLLSYLVTPGHRLYCRAKPASHRYSRFRIESAESAYGRQRWFLGALGPLAQPAVDAHFTLPGVVFGRWKKQLPDVAIDMGDWLEFLGWWIAEGSTSPNTEKRRYEWRVAIAQSQTANPEKVAKIAALLARLPFRARYSAAGHEFVIRGRQLWSALAPLGKAFEKRIPRYVFSQSPERLRRFFDAYIDGDGCRSGSLKCATTSYGLALDLAELGGLLGYGITIGKRDRRAENPNNRMCYVVGFSKTAEKHVWSVVDAARLGRPNPHYISEYSGQVYCASVPGGLLYVMRDGRPHWSGNSINPLQSLEQQGRISRMGVGGLPSTESIPAESRSVQPSHFGYVDPISTPENLRAGVDSRVANLALKGHDNRLYSKFLDAKTGETRHLHPGQIQDAVVAFPGELEKGAPLVDAMVGGRLRRVPREQVQYQLPAMEDAFGPLSNLVPMKSGIKGQRLSMGARMSSQALPLVGAEAPHVQSGVPGSQDESYEQRYGVHAGAVRAEAGGRVVGVDRDEIRLEQPDGSVKSYELSYHQPSNRKTGLHHTPMVQVGQVVQPGGLLARSNYTDAEGTVALGRNLRVAMVPGFGRHSNYEDAWVISESAAKKLTSEHYYQHDLPRDDETTFGKKAYVSAFPGKYERATLDNFDDEGVIKPGTRVKEGDPLILGIKQKEQHQAQVFRGHGPRYSDVSQTWDHHHEGVVTDVVQGKDGPRVVVRTEMPMQIGDKASNRFGGKGVVGSIVPDSSMPHDEQGRPAELLFNPAGIISRGNPTGALEFALGKIAEKTGKPYRVQDFKDIEDLSAFVEGELRKHKVSDTETVTDPRSGRKIPGVLMGSGFFMKLHHQAESKGAGRGTGGYTAEGQPARGGAQGAKRVALMSTNALLSHGATGVLQDALLNRGQANPKYWLAFMSGHTPPTPEVPFVHRKFVNQLQAAGVNVVREGTKFRTYALTSKDIDELAGDRDLRNADTVDWKGKLKPVSGGLFDEGLTGGHGGNRWEAIRLHEPMPSPVMEEPIRRLFGLTEAKYRDVLAGKEEFRGQTGPKAIASALERLDLDKELALARMDVASGKKTLRDAAVRRLGYLKAAKENNVNPADWVWHRVPVLPALFRPVSVMQGNKRPMVADANVLYKELFEANQNLAGMSKQVDDVGPERLAVYDAIKAVTGLDDPIHPKTKERGVKGVLKEVLGHGPKHSTVQRKLLAAPVDLVGRSVIIPNPDLDLDSVGIPENRAWDVYKPFIIRRLSRRGVPFVRAKEAVEKREQVARQAMLDEMKERPVILDRAPILHRYGIMAFWPKLVKGDAIHLTPLVSTGFNADYDGDTMNYQVPASDEAVREAVEKMLPSKNLLAVKNFQVHQLPNREFATGLWYATKEPDKFRTPVKFESRQAAVAAYHRGEIDADTPVEILRH